MVYCSAILEGASQVYAREIPWRLAEGCLYPIQSRYILPIVSCSQGLTNTLQVPALV